MQSEFNYVAATAKISGEARLASGHRELEHGDEVFIVARAVVDKVAFPQDKDGLITRVHYAKANECFLVDAEEAEQLMVAQREALDGQGSIIAELDRVANG